MWIDCDGKPCTTPDMFQLPSSDWTWFSDWCNKQQFVDVSVSSLDRSVRNQLARMPNSRLKKREWGRFRVRKSFSSGKINLGVL